ncbi:MAG TPA: murein L,D-transpeptidase catalytic domain family protein [Gammaproteobacteria bacterium]|jgi:hypothetical protein|nr:murein L,D-transpeptidase catalytic domain family protein [Gammaproteobacteria bacterium]
MVKIRHILAVAVLFALAGASWPFDWLFPHPNRETPGTQAWLNKEYQIIHAQAPALDSKVLQLALKAFVRAEKQGLVRKRLLTVIDYSKPSTEKRLWVFDLSSNKTVLYTWVSHGKNSGALNANSFSNKNGSLKSSLGVFVTDNAYVGGHGIALRMRGLEKGVNDNAYKRNIVFHGASYVGGNMARQLGRMGLSWGCPAVSPSIIKSLVDTIKGNTVVFAYYPDPKWLRSSRYIA